MLKLPNMKNTKKSENTDLLTTTRLPYETMKLAIEMAKLARQLNQAQWFIGWAPGDKVSPKNTCILPWGCYSTDRKG